MTPLEVRIFYLPSSPQGTQAVGHTVSWFPSLNLPPVTVGLVLGAEFFLTVEIWLWGGALLTCPPLQQTGRQVGTAEAPGKPEVVSHS